MNRLLVLMRIGDGVFALASSTSLVHNDHLCKWYRYLTDTG